MPLNKVEAKPGLLLMFADARSKNDNFVVTYLCLQDIEFVERVMQKLQQYAFMHSDMVDPDHIVFEPSAMKIKIRANPVLKVKQLYSALGFEFDRLDNDTSIATMLLTTAKPRL